MQGPGGVGHWGQQGTAKARERDTEPKAMAGIPDGIPVKMQNKETTP